MIDLNRNAYGTCGHHVANLGPGGCAVCISLEQERGVRLGIDPAILARVFGRPRPVRVKVSRGVRPWR